ncbi:MAG: hypothetical protein N2D54_11135 [Chloroflexota bacterium]
MKQAQKVIAVFVALIALTFSAVAGFAQNSNFEAAHSVLPNIHTVQTGGYWAVGEDEGFFRVVSAAGGVEHVSHRLYLQWLKNNATTQSYELVRTVYVKELNSDHGQVLEVKTSFGDENAFEINVTANSRGGGEKRFMITARGNGEYAIRSD